MNGTSGTRAAEAAGVTCEPGDVAGWIGLADAVLLGTEPVVLPAATVARLKEFGARVELSRREVAAILHVREKQVTLYMQTGRKVVLGHRKTSAKKPVISGADLAAFIAATVPPPVPTTGVKPRTDRAAAERTAREVRARHGLPRTKG